MGGTSSRCYCAIADDVHDPMCSSMSSSKAAANTKISMQPVRVCAFCRTPLLWDSSRAKDDDELDVPIACSKSCEAQLINLVVPRARFANQLKTILRDAASLEALPETSSSQDSQNWTTTAMLNTQRDVNVKGTFVTHSLWLNTTLRYIGVPSTEELRVSVPRLLQKRLPKFEWLDNLCERLEGCLPKPRNSSYDVTELPIRGSPESGEGLTARLQRHQRRQSSPNLLVPSLAQWDGAPAGVPSGRALPAGRALQRSSSCSNLPAGRALQRSSSCSDLSPRFVLDGTGALGVSPAVPRPPFLHTPTETHVHAGLSSPSAAPFGWFSLSADMLLRTPTPHDARTPDTGLFRSPSSFFSPFSPFSPFNPKNAQRVRDCRNATVVIVSVLLGVTVLYFFVRVIFLAHLIYTAKESDKVCGPLTNRSRTNGCTRVPFVAVPYLATPYLAFLVLIHRSGRHSRLRSSSFTTCRCAAAPPPQNPRASPCAWSIRPARAAKPSCITIARRAPCSSSGRCASLG